MQCRKMQGERRPGLYARPATGCLTVPRWVAVPVGVLTIAASAPFPGRKPGSGVVFLVRGFSRGFRLSNRGAVLNSQSRLGCRTHRTAVRASPWVLRRFVQFSGNPTNTSLPNFVESRVCRRCRTKHLGCPVLSCAVPHGDIYPEPPPRVVRASGG